jgi:osmoprotectant transport system permease protein
MVWGSGACLAGILAIGVAMPAWTVWGGNWQQGRADGEISSVVRVGSKTFTEQYILGQLIRARLEADGVRTEVVSGMGSAVLFDALRSGSIDVCVDYSGTLWANVLKRQDSPARDELYAALVQDLRSQFGIEVAGRLGFENTYALAVSRATADRFGLRTISDLTRNASQFSIAGDYEFFGRPEWQALQRSYGLQFRRRVPMDSTLMYSAVREEQVDVIVAFSTDGRLPAYNLVVLEDDKAALPPYDAVILVGPSRADDPRVLQTLRALSDSISPQAMREGNRRVDVDGLQPLDVGRQMASELP